MVRIADRRRVRALYEQRCGYCGVAEADVGSELTVDHFQPVSQGGSDDFANLVYACYACNDFKGDYYHPNLPGRILHPLHDDLTLHLVENPDGTLRGLTPTGTFHINRLQLNRSQLIRRRLALQEQRETRAWQNMVEQRLIEMEERMQEWERRFPRFRDNE